MTQSFSLRNQLGCWLSERWRAELVVSAPSLARALGWEWRDLCNRGEQISREAGSDGRICHWDDTSLLTACRMFPSFGTRLLNHCLTQWPIVFGQGHSSSEPAESSVPAEVSVIVPIRGIDRLPQFLATLSTLEGQRACGVEIIVVEQSWDRLVEDLLPEGIRYIHARSPDPNTPFNKSWALNVGARVATTDFLILHDADMLVPASYASSVRDLLAERFEAVRLPRLIFYLDEQASVRVAESDQLGSIGGVAEVIQNNPTPVALRTETYWRIGGHDESFFGWGGEDIEFLNRLATTRMAGGGYLPLVHLWHASAPNKSGDRNMQLLRERLEIPAKQRIESLNSLTLGQECPTLALGPKAATSPQRQGVGLDG